MMKHNKWTRYILLTLVLLTLILIQVSQLSLSASAANEPSQNAIEQVDLIKLALDEANLKGLLGKPEEINVFQSSLRELALPGDEYYDHNLVWLVWVKGTIMPTWPGIHPRPNPAKNLYIFIDADTGQAFQFLATDSPIEQLSQKSWIGVSENDIGKFNVPKFTFSEEATGDSPAPTPTPVKP